MAATVSDSAGDRYRSAQRRITASLRRDMRKLRRLLIVSQLKTTMPTWIDAVTQLVGEYGQASASLAADFYEAQREAAKVAGQFTALLADPPPDDQVSNSLRWATKDVWPRDPEAAATTDAQREPITVRLDAAVSKAEQVVQRLVADQGRGTMRQAVRSDRYAVGYARGAALGACSFCRLMASRGMVFKTAKSAGQDANEKFTGDAAVVKFHNDCHCVLIPVYRGQRFELSPHAAEWDRLYREYAAPYPGEQLNRFRQAIAAHG